LLQGMFGETNEKQTEYLRDLLASGQHLLSLINDILDLSKIEAGRMDLDVAAFDLPTAIDDALLLMRERASRRGIILERDVDERVGEIHADQRKVKQVLLSLLSNAVKFTPEGGPLAHEQQRVVDRRREIERRHVELHPARLDLGEIEDVVDQGQEVLARGEDVAEVLRLLLVRLAEHPLQQHVREPDDRVERRAQLVRHAREELGLVLAGDFELAA